MSVRAQGLEPAIAAASTAATAAATAAASAAGSTAGATAGAAAAAGAAADAATAAANAAIAASATIIPGTFTVDTLPDPALNLDRYARVTDLFGGKRDLVLASKAGTLAFWQPVRPVFAATAPVTADMTLLPLKSPTVMFLTGTVGVGVTRTLTLSTALAYPGAAFEIRNDMSGLGSLKLAGLAVGGLLSLVFGTTQRFFFDAASGWKQFS